MSNDTERDIHFGYLGNGVTCYDVSRIDPEIGDYPTVAHISPEGRISYRQQYALSDADKAKIERMARQEREAFTATWNKMNDNEKYSKIIDRAPYDQFLIIGHDELSIPEKVKKYEKSVIFGVEDFPELETYEKSASEQERRYVNSYENPEYRDYWGIDDEPDELDPPEPDDIPDLTCYDKLNR